MKGWNNFFQFYINSSIHVALAVVSLSMLTQIHYHIYPDFDLLAFVFFGCITGYNFVKYAEIAKLHHRSLARSLRTIQMFSLVSFLVFVWFAFETSPKILLWSLILGGVTLLYAVPVFAGKRNLRSISGLKVFIIALVWAGVTVVLPVLGHRSLLSADILLETGQRFLLVLVWILPFEIRDLKYDLRELETIPQQIGIMASRKLGLFLVVLVLFVEIWKNRMTTDSWIALSIMLLASSIAIVKAKPDQSRYYSSFWVEGIPILWLVVLMILQAI